MGTTCKRCPSSFPVLFPPQSSSLGHHLSQLQSMWLCLVRSKHSELALEETDWWRNAQQMSTTSWLLGHHRVNHCRHWRRRRTSPNDIENQQLSRQFSRCWSWSEKMLKRSCGGKVWRTGRRSRWVGVWRVWAAGSKGGPRAPHPLHTLHTAAALLLSAQCCAQFSFNQGTVCTVMPLLGEAGITPFTFVADDTSQHCEVCQMSIFALFGSACHTARTLNFLQPVPNYTRLTLLPTITVAIVSTVKKIS